MTDFACKFYKKRLFSKYLKYNILNVYFSHINQIYNKKINIKSIKYMYYFFYYLYKSLWKIIS